MGAPWELIQGAFEDIGYETEVALVDTKNYYIPQTRQRGYMVALHIESAQAAGLDVSEMALRWVTNLGGFQRRASSPFTDFILSDADPQLHQLKREMSVSECIEKTKHRIDWQLCRHRYFSFRAAQALGFQKPLTKWENNGTCDFPDNSWLKWAKGQVERIWDTIDINHLRCVAQRDYDMSHKMFVPLL